MQVWYMLVGKHGVPTIFTLVILGIQCKIVYIRCGPGAASSYLLFNVFKPGRIMFSNKESEIYKTCIRIHSHVCGSLKIVITHKICNSKGNP